MYTVQYTKVAEVCVLIDNIGIERITFSLDTVKRDINFKMSNALFRVIFVVLCSRIGTS